MNSINALKRELKTILGANYYYEEAPKTAAYPYRVGLLASSYDDEVSEIFSLELDYWGTSATVVDALLETDSGDGNRTAPSGLNKRRVIAGDVCAKIDREGIFDVHDPDTDLRHKRVSYTIRLYYL